jgi:hypothetical protein
MCGILRHAAQSLFLFSTKCHLLSNIVFFYSNNMFFINHMLKVNTNLIFERLRVHWTFNLGTWVLSMN